MRVHEKLLDGLRSYAALRLLTQGVSWLGTIYLIRVLDSRAFGRYGIALVVFNYLSVTYDGTLIEALVQRPPKSAAESRAVFTLLVGIGLVLAGATAALSAPLGALVGDESVAPLVSAVALALALTSFSVLPHASLAREMAFQRLAIVAAVQAICVTVAMVLLAWLGAGAGALVAGLVVGAAVRLVLLNAAACRLMLPTRHLSPAFGYLKFGGVLFADNLLWRWYTSLDTFLLGRWTGTTILGFYSVAQQIAELPLEKISTVVNEVSLPAYAELCGDRTAAAGLMLETMRTHATIGFPVFWGLAVVAPYIVPIVFGPKWALATFPLIALSAIAPLRLIGSIETPAMTGLGRPRVLLKSKLVIAPAMTLGLVLGCRLGGINGAALAWLTAFPICYAIAFRYVMQAAGITHQQIFAVIRGPAAAAALMVALVLLWCRLAAMVSPSPVFGLITSVVAGAILYVGGLRLIDPGAYRLAHSRLGQFVGLRPSQ